MRRSGVRSTRALALVCALFLTAGTADAGGLWAGKPKTRPPTVGGAVGAASRLDREPSPLVVARLHELLLENELRRLHPSGPPGRPAAPLDPARRAVAPPSQVHAEPGLGDHSEPIAALAPDLPTRDTVHAASCRTPDRRSAVCRRRRCCLCRPYPTEVARRRGSTRAFRQWFSSSCSTRGLRTSSSSRFERRGRLPTSSSTDGVPRRASSGNRGRRHGRVHGRSRLD